VYKETEKPKPLAAVIAQIIDISRPQFATQDEHAAWWTEIFASLAGVAANELNTCTRVGAILTAIASQLEQIGIENGEILDPRHH